MSAVAYVPELFELRICRSSGTRSGGVIRTEPVAVVVTLGCDWRRCTSSLWSWLCGSGFTAWAISPASAAPNANAVAAAVFWCWFIALNLTGLSL